MMKNNILLLMALTTSTICSAEGFNDQNHDSRESELKSLTVVTEMVDWTPLFRDWEDGCSFGDEYQNFVNKLFYFKDADTPFTGFVVLPQIYTGSFDPKIQRENHPKYDDGAYTDFSFNVLNGTYYGMPVRKIGYYIGNSHGLSGGYLELDPTDAQLREFLEKVEFKSTEDVMYEDYAKTGKYEEVMFNSKGIVKVEKNKITVVCDVST